MSKKESKYNKEYYAANREHILEKRKKRYQSDASVRESLAERSAKYRKQAKEERMKAGIPLDLRGRKSGPMPPRRIALDDQRIVTAYSSGYVADELGISVQTLRLWVKKGVIPGTDIWESNYRWWTQRMFNALMKAKNDCGNDVKGKEFSELVWKYWPKEG